jgi:TMEM175 potassium channel family protein
MYPKARLDALTDGIFAVAMTLLVLELRVPERELADNAALWQALQDLWPKFFPYLLSFLVLGNSWLSKIRVRMAAEHVTRTYAVFWLANLLLVTCVPFSTMLVGRYADVPLAIWVYVGNLGLNGLTALAMVLSMRDAHEASSERPGGVIVLIVSCVLAAIIAAFAPQHALWALLLNALPVVAYRKSRSRA